jgi:hypothetical protein
LVLRQRQKSFIRIDKKDRIFFSGSSIPGKGSNSLKAAKSDSILDGFSSGTTDRSLDPTDEPDQLRFKKNYLILKNILKPFIVINQ